MSCRDRADQLSRGDQGRPRHDHHLAGPDVPPLVLLSIIIVGQNVQAAASDQRVEATYQDADAVLHTALAIQEHMAAQDAEIDKILQELRIQRA